MFAVTGYNSAGFSDHSRVQLPPESRPAVLSGVDFRCFSKARSFKTGKLCVEQKFMFTFVLLCFKSMQIHVCT